MTEIQNLPVTLDADQLGPAMLDCTEQERLFVYAKCEFGYSNADAYRFAGYSCSNPNVIGVGAWRVAHRGRVQSALLEQSRALMKAEGPKSIRTLIGLRDDTKIKADIRLKASVELLNRATLGAVAESRLTVTHELSPAQLDAKILSVAAELGLDRATAEKMLIDPANIVEGEFEEVPVDPVEQERRDRENARRDELRAMSPAERKAAKAAKRAEQREAAKRKYEAAQIAANEELFAPIMPGEFSNGEIDAT